MMFSSCPTCRASRCWRRRAREPSSTCPTTLRFKERSAEVAFIKRWKESLSTTFMVAVVFCLFLHIVQIVLIAVNWTSGGGQFVADGRAAGAIKIRNAALIGGALFVTAIAIVVRTCRWRMSPVAFEVFVALVWYCSIPLTVCAYPWYSARLAGLNPYEVVVNRSSFDDVNLLFNFVIYVGVLHSLPIRWVVLFGIEVAYAAAYPALALILGSPMEPVTVFWNTLSMIVAVFLSAFQRRNVEIHQRMSFVNLVGEKALRVQAEHKMEFMHEQMSQVGEMVRSKESGAMKKHVDCENASFVTFNTDGTTATEGVFKASNESRLEQIALLGYQEHWLVRPEDLHPLPGAILGMGGFGMVVAAEFHGAVVALKAPRNRGSNVFMKNAENDIAHELRIFRRVRHPSILLFYGACISPVHGELCLVLEFVAGRPLNDLGKGLVLEDEGRCCIATDVSSALRYLHSQTPCIVHGDIKDSNTMVQNYPGGGVHAKLLDFGLSRLLTRRSRWLGGTLRWTAPELVAGLAVEPGPAADVYAYGLLLYFITTGQQPHGHLAPGVAAAVLRKTVGSGRCPFAWGSSGDLASCVRELCEACAEVEFEKRPSMKEVHQRLPWLAADSFSGEGFDVQLDRIRRQCSRDRRPAKADQSTSSSSNPWATRQTDNFDVLGEQNPYARRIHLAGPSPTTASEQATTTSEAPDIDAAARIAAEAMLPRLAPGRGHEDLGLTAAVEAKRSKDMVIAL